MDGIVLLAKRPGKTSFSSLFNVKKALNTTKVGHTGTLDSFAQGLLVVCTGRYTRLASNITEFNKTYKAVISFGKETDTLEYTGLTVKKASLPTLNDLQSAITKFTGKQLQAPPSFSAIHIDGQRASDLARKGKNVEIPKREITVYKAELEDYKLNEDNLVESCLIHFEVSKGTYIRSLARDIANECNSAGYLSGLFRTQVGNFNIQDSAGYSLLEEFSIENCLQIEKEYLKNNKLNHNTEEKSQSIKKVKTPYVETDEDKLVKKEIIEKILPVNKAVALECGFYPVTVKGIDEKNNFLHGKPLRKNFFNEYMDGLKDKQIFSVFSNESDKEAFLGLIEWKDENKLAYKFVNN